MNRKITIALALALAGVLSTAVPLTASGGPLLSGYGGPGAGEQTLVGSTLLGGPHGGAGSGGSGSTGSGGAGLGAPGGNLSGTSISTGAGGARTGAGGGSSSTGESKGSGVASHAGFLDAQAGRAGSQAFVYPSSLRSASAGSPPLGMSGGTILLLAGIVAVLALVGTYTMRLNRLQP